jgi:methyl-accepting chemotaxis protein
MAAKRFGSVSVRAVLAAVFCGLAAFLIFSSGLAIHSAWRQSELAGRVDAVARLDKVLFELLQHVRRERGGVQTLLAAPGAMPEAAKANLDDARAKSAAAYAAVKAAARAVSVPRKEEMLAQLAKAHEALVALRGDIDAALRVAKPERNAEVVGKWGPVMTDLNTRIEALGDGVENSVALIDPVADHNIRLKRLAWEVRQVGGQEFIMLGEAINAGGALPAEKQLALAGLRGRQATAWNAVLDAVAAGLADKSVAEAVAAAKDVYGGAGAEERAKIYRALVAGEGVTIAGAEWNLLAGEVFGRLGAVATAAMTVLEQHAEARKDEAGRALLTNFGLLGAALALLAVGIFLVHSRVTRPILVLIGAIQRLAGGDYASPVPPMPRDDELGRMRAALVVLQENAAAAAAMSEARQREQEALAHRGERVQTLCATFDAAVRDTLATVERSSAEMESTAGTMSIAAERTNDNARNVAKAADEASSSVQTVATAAEELATSIAEIGRQAALSTQIAANAVEKSTRTNAVIATLAEASQKIGEIIGLISGIAGQTNLLALNATIEAARAGEAGKGFAVVASEVKSLAGETAKATQEIGSQIARIQSVSQEVVAAIQEFGSSVGEVQSVSAAIAAAVEEQRAATAEIARHVQDSAACTTTIATRVEEVRQTADENAAAAAQTKSAAQSLSENAERLRHSVADFLGEIKAA